MPRDPHPVGHPQPDHPPAEFRSPHLATRPAFRPALVVATFALLLLAATFFVGDTGVYNDDYFLNERDPVTGQIHTLVMHRSWHLWRPLTRRVLTPLVTTFWPHPWILHAISAALHACVVALVYALLRRLGIRAATAAPCALAFMLYPVHFEAVLWNAIICTLMSAIAMLAVWHAYVWWLRDSHRSAGWARASVLVAMGLLTWASAAFNEQPVGALAALALAPAVVGLAAGRSLGRARLRTIIPALPVGIALVIYIRGFLRHTPAMQGHDPAGILTGLSGRIADLASKVPGELVMRRFALGAWDEGVRAMLDHPARSLVLLGVLAVLGALWIVRPTSAPASPRAATREPADSPRSLAMLALLGVVWFATSWIPVVLSHSITSPRLHYVPAIGLTIAAAALASFVREVLVSRGVECRNLRAVKAAFAGAILAALVCWIGLEANFQKRYLADQAEIAPLAAAFSGSTATETLFLPVRIRSATARTGSKRFDDYFRHCWYWEFASGWRTQAAMRSTSAFTVQTSHGAHPYSFANDPSLVLFRAPLAPPGLSAEQEARLVRRVPGEPGRLISWDHVVPFEVESTGVTRVFTSIRVHLADSSVVDVKLPLVAPKGLPARVLDVYPVPRPTPGQPRHAPGVTPSNAPSGR